METLRHDELKRGRWDGMDVLSLGTAFERIYPLPPTNTHLTTTTTTDTDAAPWMTDWTESVIGASQRQAPTTTVSHMLRATAGSLPDLILEGFSETERWSLRMEQGWQASTTTATLTPTRRLSPDGDTDSAFTPLPTPALTASSSEEGDGSPETNMPTRQLWSTLWGSEPPPASLLPTLEEIDSAATSEDDPILDLAAESSVPIDVDEDTFIVSTREHLDAIHAIAAVPLQAGRWEAALRILNKLLVGLDTAAVCDAHVKQNLRGATCHNMGLIYLWQGHNFAAAAEHFGQAVQARQDCPMVSSRELAVTHVRHGQALFALRRFAKALECFEWALKLTPQESVVRAKILANIGVAHYHIHDLPSALQAFTQALTLQRKFLDEPVRRESLVYDASVTLSNMGKLYLERGDDGMASFVYEEALLLLKTVLRKEHPLVLQSLANLALSKARQGKVRKAIKLLERCRRGLVETYSTSAAPVMETCGWMAHLCAAQNMTVQAQTLYEAVAAWQAAFLPPLHPARVKVQACLQSLQEGSHTTTTTTTMSNTTTPWL